MFQVFLLCTAIEASFGLSKPFLSMKAPNDAKLVQPCSKMMASAGSLNDFTIFSQCLQLYVPVSLDYERRNWTVKNEHLQRRGRVVPAASRPESAIRG